MRSRFLSGLALALALASPAVAFAHLELLAPVSRYGRNFQKEGPCGLTGGPRSANVNYFRPGETIQVRFNEFINHPGHYRIAFDADGADAFVDPPCLANCDTTTPTIEFNSNEAVLLDAIPDQVGGETVLSVTLPAIECNNCTLQVIQVMYDKPPYTLPGNDLYYQCADLVLTNSPPPADGGMGPSPDAGPQPEDSGVQPIADAGVGSPVDAGDLPIVDAGAPPADSGTAPAPAADAGLAAAPDAAPSGDDSGALAGSSCRCLETSSNGALALLGLLVLPWLLRRRPSPARSAQR